MEGIQNENKEFCNIHLGLLFIHVELLNTVILSEIEITN